ncbi:DUF3169 family protein [Solibacillus sp. FSL W7-1436]|uniref:DUF3169 family protein n=1 Tax=unclassified Solibacillus TaxID=2637870 RepID=UPI0030CB87C4
MKRTLKQFLFGGLIGGLIGSFIVTGEFTLPLYEIATEMTIVFLGIALLLAVGGYIKLAQLKRQSLQQLSGEDEDLHEENLYKLYSDASLAINMSLIISIAGACVGIITEQSIGIQILSVPIILIAIIAIPLVGNYIKYVYPYREIPSYNDKHYTKKMFEMSDEGERHIMLQGLYSAFNLTNILLLCSLLLCMFYSVASGESQLFAILIIALILITVNTKYILKVRNR